MPIYEYRCNDCKHEFETEQRMVEDPLTKCPKCKGKIQRIIGKNIGIAFKGSGFYVNDNKKSAIPKKVSTKKTETKKANPACKTCKHNKECK
jgi:putative FmdB family regulatory protein